MSCAKTIVGTFFIRAFDQGNIDKLLKLSKGDTCWFWYAVTVVKTVSGNKNVFFNEEGLSTSTATVSEVSFFLMM